MHHHPYKVPPAKVKRIIKSDLLAQDSSHFFDSSMIWLFVRGPNTSVRRLSELSHSTSNKLKMTLCTTFLPTDNYYLLSIQNCKWAKGKLYSIWKRLSNKFASRWTSWGGNSCSRALKFAWPSIHKHWRPKCPRKIWASKIQRSS